MLDECQKSIHSSSILWSPSPGLLFSVSPRLAPQHHWYNSTGELSVRVHWPGEKGDSLSSIRKYFLTRRSLDQACRRQNEEYLWWSSITFSKVNQAWNGCIAHMNEMSEIWGTISSAPLPPSCSVKMQFCFTSCFTRDWKRLSDLLQDYSHL